MSHGSGSARRPSPAAKCLRPVIRPLPGRLRSPSLRRRNAQLTECGNDGANTVAMPWDPGTDRLSLRVSARWCRRTGGCERSGQLADQHESLSSRNRRPGSRQGFRNEWCQLYGQVPDRRQGWRHDRPVRGPGQRLSLPGLARQLPRHRPVPGDRTRTREHRRRLRARRCRTAGRRRHDRRYRRTVRRHSVPRFGARHVAPGDHGPQRRDRNCGIRRPVPERPARRRVRAACHGLERGGIAESRRRDGPLADTRRRVHRGISAIRPRLCAARLP